MKNTILYDKNGVPAFYMKDGKMEPLTPTGVMNYLAESPIAKQMLKSDTSVDWCFYHQSESRWVFCDKNGSV